MQTCVNIFQNKLLYIFLYLVNVTIRILNNCSFWIRYLSYEQIILTRYIFRKKESLVSQHYLLSHASVNHSLLIQSCLLLGCISKRILT